MRLRELIANFEHAGWYPRRTRAPTPPWPGYYPRNGTEPPFTRCPTCYSAECNVIVFTDHDDYKIRNVTDCHTCGNAHPEL